MISKRKCFPKGQEPDFKKRYWYGRISQYYPAGFLEDIDATCDTLEELKSLKSKENGISYSWEVFWDSNEKKKVEIKDEVSG